MEATNNQKEVDLNFLSTIHVNTLEAQDNLFGAKVSQAHHANRH
jgi:hypothetical protein